MLDSQFIPTAYSQHQVLFVVKTVVYAQIRQTPLSPDLYTTGIIQIQLVSDHTITRNQATYCNAIALAHPDQPILVNLTHVFETQHDAV
ncbi:hypothetical protein [Secundilactobacillus similis]|nr:hypothetical protein [Secundilactobacillus similis]